MIPTPGTRAVAIAVGSAAAGLVAAIAWDRGMWGLLAGALLVVLWFATLAWWMVARPRAELRPAAEVAVVEVDAHRLLLDAAPTPMLGVEGDAARALNRAARALFGTDDRVLPLPPALADPAAGHLRHEGRRWRIDRVALAGERTLVALVDVEREERTAEARAAAEMIQVLGHELLNGLAPIASLADSGLAVIEQPALLAEILATLARRAEGLQRFAEAYRALARLPDPLLRAVPPGEVAADLARLFAGRWPGVALAVEVEDTPPWPIDRDQIAQALWALLQNAAEAVADRVDARVSLAMTMVDGALAIDVADNGAGIAPDVAARIFRPFHTTKPGGTGIGLSLARQIALAHGGTLDLVAGPATVFRMMLPERPA